MKKKCSLSRLSALKCWLSACAAPGAEEAPEGKTGFLPLKAWEFFLYPRASHRTGREESQELTGEEDLGWGWGEAEGARPGMGEETGGGCGGGRGGAKKAGLGQGWIGRWEEAGWGGGG